MDPRGEEPIPDRTDLKTGFKPLAIAAVESDWSLRPALRTGR